jgi:hypothetical protein
VSTRRLASVRVIFSGHDRNSRPHQASNHDDNQGDEKAEENARKHENQEDPAGSAHGGDIATNRGCGIALNSASEHGDVAADSNVCAQPNAATKGSCISADLTLIFEDNASPEGGHVAVDFSTHPNAAAEAGRLLHFFAGANVDIAVDLCAVTTFAGALRRRKCNTRDQA